MKTKLIYNPHAGSKKRLFPDNPGTLLQEISTLLHKYEIAFDESPTNAPGDVRRLAHEAVTQGYDLVIVAGGDGTVGEAAQSLIGTNTTLGILPLGTYMNVARMLSIPFQLEKAVMILKMCNVRTIDVGEILSLEEEQIDGQRVNEPSYFLESAGVGLGADFQKTFLSWEKGNWNALWKMLKDMRQFYKIPLHVELDGNQSFDSHTHMLLVSNGPYMGAGLAVAPSAKLNDHVFTIHRYRMSKGDLFKHFFLMKLLGYRSHPDVLTYTSKFVRITSREKRPVDADARVFGHTPVSLTIKPKAFKVIVGYPDVVQDSALLSKTYLRP